MKIKFDIKKSIIIILSALVLAGVHYVNNKVLIISFEQLIYSATKTKGSGTATIFYASIYIIISFIIICPLVLLPTIDFGKKLAIKIKNKIINLYPIKNIKLYSIILLLVSCTCLLSEFKFFTYVKNAILTSSEIFDDYYVDANEIEITFPNEKRNLIYIMVESLESSNISKENGGLLDETVIPNLEKLALENINFSHNDKIGGAYQSNGSNWTMASMIANTSAVPLKFSLKDINPNSTKFTNIKTIGDVLSENGYNSYLLLGSDSEFGGRKAYFANHDYLIKDYNSAIEEGKIETDYYEWWGYEDAKLFSYAKEMLEEISKEDRPFNLTMLTVDTHFTDGYLDKSCSSVFENNYANSFYCSDGMVFEFVEWIKKQPFYENTTIVIVGDHFTMQDGFYDKDDYDKRSIYNVFINTAEDTNYNNKNRIFTSMDMFPTTVAALGGNIKGDRIGLGTNLFSDKKTIPEIIGMDKFNEEISKGSHYYYNNIRK